MPHRLAEAVRHLSRRFAPDDRSDGHLLTRFLDHRDADAFEALVRRHGPMVLGVCRRQLGDGPDADDAFQATFLVLVCKAATVRPRERVGFWLYGVARTTAVRAKAARAKRFAREVPFVEAPDPRTDSTDDRLALLDVELSRLPEKYRVPIVLCDLGGKSHADAAAHLGWPVGTLSGRLSRGRAMLAARLRRPGLAAGAAVGVSEGLTAATVRLVAGGAVPARVLVLTEGVVKAMLMSKLKVAVPVLAFIACGPVVVAHRPVAAVEPGKPAEAKTPSAGGFVPTRQALPGESGPPDTDAARKELEQLKAQAARLGERMADLERQLAAPEAKPSDIAWEALGVRLRPVSADRVRHAEPLLRGGLEVVAIRPSGPADRAEVQAGDILIGLGLWETLAPNHIAFVLGHPEGVKEGAVRCYLIRGGRKITRRFESISPARDGPPATRPSPSP